MKIGNREAAPVFAVSLFYLPMKPYLQFFTHLTQYFPFHSGHLHLGDSKDLRYLGLGLIIKIPSDYDFPLLCLQ